MTFNPRAALAAAKLCQLAYDKPTLRRANTQARVDYAPGQIDITIPGTNDRRDVLQDALILQRDLGQGQFAHRGFASHWATLRPVMGAAMLAHARPATIRAQGHSLGAACTVLMIAATPKWFAGATVHLFGCPQVGNSNLAEIFDRNCHDLGITVWRVVNRGDPVARIEFPGDWQHVWQLVEIGEDGDRELDHPIASYIRDLESIVARIDARVDGWQAQCEPHPLPPRPCVQCGAWIDATEPAKMTTTGPVCVACSGGFAG